MQGADLADADIRSTCSPLPPYLIGNPAREHIGRRGKPVASPCGSSRDGAKHISAAMPMSTEDSLTAFGGSQSRARAAHPFPTRDNGTTLSDLLGQLLSGSYLASPDADRCRCLPMGGRDERCWIRWRFQ